MAAPQVPEILFGRWAPWSMRPRPSQDFGVPKHFGVLGLYILSCGNEIEISMGEVDAFDLPQSVIYVGMSRHVDRRLEVSHAAVTRYRMKTGDNQLHKLQFAIWRSEWSSNAYAAVNSVVHQTAIAFYERAVIHSFVDKYGRLPMLNGV